MLQRFNYLAAAFAAAAIARAEIPPEFNYPANYLTPGNSGQSSSFTQGTLVGNGVTFTETRSTTGTFTDWEGVVRTALVNEARFNGLRRVQNLVQVTSDGDYSGWLANNATLVSSVTGPDPFGGNRAGLYTVNNSGFYRINATTNVGLAGRTYVGTMWVQGVGASIGKSLSVWLFENGATPSVVITLSAGWQRVVVVRANATGGSDIRFGVNEGGTLVNGDQVRVYGGMIQDVTGQSNQNPSEYVSVGVLPSPWNGAGVDGVKYFTTQNGNTVAANVVTAGTGAALPNGATYLQGLLIEPNAATNLALWCRDLTNAAWVKVNITPALTATGADGSPNSATTLTATLANGTVLQTIVDASAQRVQSAWIRRRTGTGTVNMTQDNGLTWTPLTLTGTYQQLAIPNQTTANPIIGFQIVTNGDAVDVDYVQQERGTNASSAIATTTAAVVRAADLLNNPNVMNQTAGSAAIDFYPLSAVSTALNEQLIGRNDTASGVPLFIAAPGSQLNMFDGSTNVSKTGLSYPVGVRTKNASAWAGTIMNVAKDGAAGTPGTFDGNMGLSAITTIGYGNAGATDLAQNMLIFNIAYNSVTPANVQTATV